MERPQMIKILWVSLRKLLKIEENKFLNNLNKKENKENILSN
jgi:hypothetical protein